MVKASCGEEVMEIDLYINNHKLRLSFVMVKPFAPAKLFGEHFVCKLDFLLLDKSVLGASFEMNDDKMRCSSILSMLHSTGFCTFFLQLGWSACYILVDDPWSFIQMFSPPDLEG